MSYRITIALAALLLSSCATAISGQMQEVMVETEGATGAMCYLRNEDFNYRFYPPQKIQVTKSQHEWELECVAPGNRRKTVTIEPVLPTSSYFNIMNGVFPGGMVDHTSGALYELPKRIVIDFSDVEAKPFDEPDYQKVLARNPELKGLEEFRAGKPALLRDMYEVTPTLERREAGSFDSGAEDMSEAPSASSSGPVLTGPMGPADTSSDDK